MKSVARKEEGKMLRLKNLWMLVFIPVALGAQKDILLDAMQEELNRSFKVLKHAEEAPFYFLQYAVTDEHLMSLSASYGAIKKDEIEHHRYLTVDARVGSYKLDNTHELRGGGFDFMSFMPHIGNIPVEDAPDAIKAVIWKETDRAFKQAQQRFIKVKADKDVKVAERDTSDDFSPVKPSRFVGKKVEMDLDPEVWKPQLKRLSAKFKKYPWIYGCSVSLTANGTNKYIVNNEGTKIREGLALCRISVYAKTVADDGMELYLRKSFHAHNISNLPAEEKIANAIDSLIANLKALREAPLVDPYTGPAILVNEASGVFFHEIFGHRMEGHRQKSEQEGQTFTGKVGEKILPEFLSVYMDPTIKEFNDVELRGYYKYDDEGVPGKRVTLVENGVLKNFIMSRSPIEGFPKSNGHGRRSYGEKVVARQSNLIVESRKQVPFDKLRELLIEECKKQDKPYGLIFYDISGGFTVMQRSFAQVFKVIPLLVCRVYTDGRPDEIVRGVDIVGTPLTCFGKITATADDPIPFNGTCGAESGWVPVSAISPSILVSEIEIEKKVKAQDKPPLLKAPKNQGTKKLKN